MMAAEPGESVIPATTMFEPDSEAVIATEVARGSAVTCALPGVTVVGPRTTIPEPPEAWATVWPLTTAVLPGAMV